jgi:FKBP-type peptidyl-prolyl cis-trans isomerase
MKSRACFSCLIALLAAAMTVSAAANQAVQVSPSADLAARYSYALGMQIAARLADTTKGLTNLFDAASFTRAIEDSVYNRPPAMSEQEAAKVIITAFSEKNRAEGEAFLAANAKADGVHVTKTGLQYNVLRTGTGPLPKSNDTVRVHYRGMFVDGTEFESSYQNGQAAQFALSGPDAVIDGCAEALQLMPTGSLYRIVVPPHLGYGERGATRTIGPNTTLIYVIDLLEIVR